MDKNNKLNRYNNYILIICALMLSACASMARVEGMKITKNSSINVKEDSTLIGMVSVGKVSGGGNTNPLWTSLVTEEEYTKSLSQSLNEFQILNTNNGENKYILNAKLLSADHPWTSFGGFYCTVSISYLLTDKDGNNIYKKKITTYYQGKSSLVVGGHIRRRNAVEGSIKKNIEELIIDLRNI